MCRFRSGVAVYNATDGSVKLYTLPGEDSHTKIREHYHIRDNGGPAASRQCPVEYVPHSALDHWASYEFCFDAFRPDWWTQEHTDSVIRQFQADIHRLLKRKKWNWGGDLYLDSLTSLPEGVALSAGRALDLRSLTSLPEGVTLSAGGYLDLRSLTSLPAGVTVKATRVYMRGQWHSVAECRAL